MFRRKVNPLRDAFATMASDRFPTSVIPLAERVYFQVNSVYVADLRAWDVRITA